MITILFAKQKLFAAGPVRNLLKQHVPLYQWMAGELDDGQGDCPTPFATPILISGRSASESIFVEVREDHRPEPDLPPHAQKVRIARPTTDGDVLAERIATLVASTTAFVDKAALARFDGSDRWMNLEELVKLTDLVIKGERLSGILPAFGRPIGSFAAPSEASAKPPEEAESGSPAIRSRIASLPFPDRRPRERSAALGFDTLIMATTEKAMAQALSQTSMGSMVDFGALPDFHDEQVSTTRLPTLVLLFDRFARPDREKLAEILNVFDEDGGWSVASEGAEFVASGRGGRIRLAHDDTPLPPWMVELALDRSLGATPGEPMARLRAHRSYLTIRADLDCTIASWQDIRQTAKAMMCAFAIAARPQHDQAAYAVGCYNAATQSCFTADMLDDLVGALSQNEVSIKTFVWHAFPETAPGQVSMSSSGLLPFIGREVEVLDAPGTIDHVGEQLNMIERYLLIEGPVMGDGDTIAADAGDPLARAWHAMSDAHGRDEAVPTLRFEIRGPDGRWRPRHDRPRGDPPIGAGGLTLPEAKHGAPPGVPSHTPAPVDDDAHPDFFEDAMGLVTRTEPGAFHSAVTLNQLKKWLPRFRWSHRELSRASHLLVGERDDGPSLRIMVAAFSSTLPRLLNPPPHRFFINVNADASGDRSLARKAVLIASCACLVGSDKAGHMQLGAGGNWLSEDDAINATTVAQLDDIGDFDLQIGSPPTCFADIDPRIAGAFEPLSDDLAGHYLSIPVDRGGGRGQADIAPVPVVAPTIAPPSRPERSSGQFVRRVGGFGRRGL